MGTSGLGTLKTMQPTTFFMSWNSKECVLLREAVSELQAIAKKEELERDDAQVVLAIAAICLAKQGKPSQ